MSAAHPTTSAEDGLDRHLEWLYGKGGVYKTAGTPCLCEHAYKSPGRLHGVTMGKGWVRTTTHPDCPHHPLRPRTLKGQAP